MEATIYTLGKSRLDLNLEGLTDGEVLQEAAKHYPEGVNVLAPNTNVTGSVVWLHPGHLKTLGMPDGGGLELTGLSRVGAELFRLAADPDRAEALGAAGINRLVKQFITGCTERAVAKKPNQVHAYRWGFTAKMAGSNVADPDKLYVHPDGRVMREICQAFGVEWEDRATLKGAPVGYLRHPFPAIEVLYLDWLPSLTKNLVMLNIVTLRKVTKGDVDGDAGAFFPGCEDWVEMEALKHEIQGLVPNNDATLLVRGIASHETEAEMWGENIFADGKTLAKKATTTFTKSLDEWVTSHERMTELANKYTPFAYRISDICAQMAAVGVPGAAVASLIGAVVEEDFYLGLSGGPKGLDEALESWFRARQMGKAQRQMILRGLNTVLAPGLLHGPVAIAILEGARLNQGRIDERDAGDLIIRAGFNIGKGKISYGEGADTLAALGAIITDPSVPEDLYDNLVGRMAFYATRKLGQVIFAERAGSEDEDLWGGLEDPWADAPETDFGDEEYTY